MLCLLMMDVGFCSSTYICSIGGLEGGVPGVRPAKGPDSFVLTYKIFKT